MWENNNRQCVYLRWSYTAQRKSNHAEGFSPTLEEGTTNIPKPMPGRVIVLYTFFLLLYKEWSNQARKRVSSVCRRVKRDFQNNPLSRWGFFFFFLCITFVRVCFKIAEEMTIIAQTPSSWMAGPFFFLFFQGAMHNYCIACPHMWCGCVIIQSLDRSYFVKWNAELLHTQSRSWSDTCK